MQAVERVTSIDGTTIAFERAGTGPALITVDAAGSYRDFRPFPPPVEALAGHFTVYVYDRRGRGASTDTPPFAVEREADDLAALVAAGRRRDAVEFFHRGIGVPDDIMAQMTPPVWAALEAVAPTFVYDCRLSDAMSLPLIRSVTTPTLVLDSQGSSPSITESAATVAAALPNSTHRSLP